MKRRFLSRILSIVASVLLIFTMSSCIDLGKDETSATTKRNYTGSTVSKTKYTGEVTELTVSVYAAGFGQAWIDEACRIYEEEHPGVKFKIRANSRMFDTVKTELSTDVCKSDVVLVAYYDYLNLSTTGKLEDLSSVYSSTVPGGTKTVMEATASEQTRLLFLGENKDKIYGIPWQDSLPNGFVYNKKIFKQYNIEVPKTMDEFFALCDTLGENGVAPLVYGGGQQDAYVTMTPPLWLIEYYGYDYIQNTFELYESPEIYNYTSAGRLKAFETLAKLLKGNLSNGNSIALTGSNAFTAQAAQREFIKGNAAMVICGAWFKTEMKSVLKDYPDFEYGYFPVPHINSDLKDVNGNDTEYVNYSLQANILSIPSTSKNKEIAKDFLLSMYSKESYTTFVKSNNGVTRPIDIEVDETVIDDYALGTYLRSKNSKKNNICVYETSSSPMAVNGYLGIMNFSGTDYYLSIINASSYENALSIARTASQQDYQTALSFWDSKNNNWDEKYLIVR